MITIEHYEQYIRDFNAACAGDGSGFADFYERYFEPNAVFEYIPKATKNMGKDMTVRFWQGVHETMHETIQPHRSLLINDKMVAAEMPIDFVCKKAMEWVGVERQAGESFRLMVAGFYHVSSNDKFEYVRETVI